MLLAQNAVFFGFSAGWNRDACYFISFVLVLWSRADTVRCCCRALIGRSHLLWVSTSPWRHSLWLHEDVCKSEGKCTAGLMDGKTGSGPDSGWRFLRLAPFECFWSGPGVEPSTCLVKCPFNSAELWIWGQLRCPGLNLLWACQSVLRAANILVNLKVCCF